MKKRIIRFISLLTSVVLLIAAITSCTQNESNTGNETVNVENDPDKVVWKIKYFGMDEEYAAKIQSSINAILQEKQAGYLLELSIYTSDYEDATAPIEEMRKNGEQADLISFPSMAVNVADDDSVDVKSCKNPYNERGSEFLIPLDTYLESEDGQRIQQNLTEYDLKRCEIDGYIYGLPSRCGNSSYIACEYNKSLLEKYDIDVSELSDNIFENIDILQKVHDGEMAENNNINAYVFNSTVYGDVGMPALANMICDMVRLDSDGVFVNVAETDKFCEIVEKIKELKDQGILYSVQKEGNAYSNFFAMSTVAYSDEIVESSYESVDTIIVPDRDRPRIDEYMFESSAIGISSWCQNTENAFDFLTRIYTDPEIANLLQYGIEGESYNLEDNSVVYITDEFGNSHIPSYITSYISYPEKGSPSDKIGIINKFRESYDSYFPYGFYFDFEPVASEINAVRNVIYANGQNIGKGGWFTPEYEDLISGDVDDVDAAIDKLNSDLEAAGIDKIIEEANRQLEEWRAGKS